MSVLGWLKRFWVWLTLVEPRNGPSRDASRDRSLPGKQRIKARREATR